MLQMLPKDLKDRKEASGAKWCAVPDVVMCKSCDDNKVALCRNMCRKCYRKNLKDKKLADAIMCKSCDDNEVVCLRNMCYKCYQKYLKDRKRVGL